MVSAVQSNGATSIMKERILEVKQYYSENINDIEKYNNIIHKCLLLLSILESLSQFNYFSREKDNKKKFCKFIKEFSNWKEHDSISGILACYELKEKRGPDYFFNDKLYPKLNSFSEYNIKEIIQLGKKENIFEILKNHKINLAKYTYSALLYKFRSKLVHEFRTPSGLEEILRKSDAGNAFYKCIRDISSLNGNNCHIRLIFPYRFIKKLVRESIEKYLKKCEKENVDPFEKAEKYYHWYE